MTSEKSEKENVCTGDKKGHSIIQLMKPHDPDVVLEKVRDVDAN